MKVLKAHYDVVVIGGGIQGAGIALVARKAGYSVLLVEKNTWGSETSSKSSKLIHGGLRYLQTGQFKLVYECLAERQWMLKTLPDLVKPNWFYIPIYKQSYYRPWKIFLGLFIYRIFSGFSGYGRFRKVPRDQWSQLAGINQTDLQSVFAYQDAQTDDQALTQRVVETLLKASGDALEHAQCISAERTADGYCLKLKHDQTSVTVNTPVVVNATGPWVNQTLSNLLPDLQPLAIDLVQGSHLVVSPQLSDQCFYLQAPQDNRAVFCLPWKGKTLIGTTEKVHQQAPEVAEVTSDEISYLCDVVKYYFPDYSFSIDTQFCGLRVLPRSSQRAFSRPRDTILNVDEAIISVYGGKLTGWRATAFKTLRIINQLSPHYYDTSPNKIMD